MENVNKIFCKELNKTFDSKADLIKDLRIYKDEIIALKKAQIYKSCEKGISITAKPLDYLKLSTQTKDIPLDDKYYYIAVNSSRILDSHLDVHLDGNWNKSVKEQQGKNYLVDTHVMSVNSTIARKEYVEMFTAMIPFSMIGKAYEGDTYVLIYKVRKDKIISRKAKEWLDSGDSIESSVRMQYMDIEFAINSDEKEDVKFKKNFDKVYPIIANKEDFDSEINYFWMIKQAKNVLESSLVLAGSNNATGQISINDKPQPQKSTGKNIQPSDDTEKRKFLLNLLKN